MGVFRETPGSRYGAPRTLSEGGTVVTVMPWVLGTGPRPVVRGVKLSSFVGDIGLAHRLFEKVGAAFSRSMYADWMAALEADPPR